MASTSTVAADICVIGAGSAGLTVAAGASQLGASTVLVESNRMGGDCLNFGCVPSKALLAAADAAEAVRRARIFGIDTPSPAIDFRRIHDHVHRVIAAIAPHDSVERFEGMGVRVIRAEARFVGRSEIVAGDHRIRARRFVIATGSSPLIPAIPGIERVAYLTNETVFDLTQLPSHLIIIGGGPIGCELGQAFRRLGAAVSIVEMAEILPQDDPELVEAVRQALRSEGIALHERAKAAGIEPAPGGIALMLQSNGELRRLEGSHVLVAAGRRANVAGLGLEAAAVDHSDNGIVVDARMRTTNRRIYAIGDVAGRLRFTHVAGYHAAIVIRNALFRLPARADTRAIPWVTFTDPELAHVGATEAAARNGTRDIRVLRWPLAQNDRAQAERVADGFAKVVTTARGRILGASIVGPQAGELIQPWVLGVGRRLRIGALAQMIAPYPTLGEINKRVAGSYFAPTLFGDRTRRIVRFLSRFG